MNNNAKRNLPDKSTNDVMLTYFNDVVGVVICQKRKKKLNNWIILILKKLVLLQFVLFNYSYMQRIHDLTKAHNHKHWNFALYTINLYMK